MKNYDTEVMILGEQLLKENFKISNRLARCILESVEADDTASMREFNAMVKKQRDQMTRFLTNLNFLKLFKEKQNK